MPEKLKYRVCGVDCHPGDANCNNYCNSHPNKKNMTMPDSPSSYIAQDTNEVTSATFGGCTCSAKEHTWTPCPIHDKPPYAGTDNCPVCGIIKPHGKYAVNPLCQSSIENVECPLNLPKVHYVVEVIELTKEQLREFTDKMYNAGLFEEAEERENLFHSLFLTDKTK